MVWKSQGSFDIADGLKRTSANIKTAQDPTGWVNSMFRSSLNPTVLGEEKALSKLRHLWVSSKSQKLVAVNQKASHHKVPTQQQKQLLLLTPPAIFSISCFLFPQSPPSGWIFALINARHLHSIINVFIFPLLPPLSTLSRTPPHPQLLTSPGRATKTLGRTSGSALHSNR